MLDVVQALEWIRDNIDTIARALAKSAAQYFNLEFREP